MNRAWVTYADLIGEDATYALLPLEPCAPIDGAVLDGRLAWLRPFAERSEVDVLGYTGRSKLADATRAIDAATRLGFVVPPAYVKFMTELHAQVPATSGCFVKSTEVVDDDRDVCIIGFLADSQGLAMWYLRLLADGGHHVVGAFAPDEAEPVYFVCADSFEQLLYRFWLESSLADRLSRGDSLSASEQAYCDELRRQRAFQRSRRTSSERP